MLKQSRFLGLYPYILGLSGLLFCGLLCLPWAPGFPVTAKMIAVPGLFIIRAPEDAVIERIFVNKKDTLHPGQRVLKLRYLHSLSQNTKESSDLKQFENQLFRLNEVLTQQVQLYNKYQLLANKKLISELELLQKKDEMRRLLDEKTQLTSQIKNLKLKMSTCFKLPFQGRLAEQLVQVGQVVKAKQVLMAFRPRYQKYTLKVRIPIIYQKYIKMKQMIRLNYIQNQKIKTYPIKAKVVAIYPRIFSQNHLGKQNYYLVLSADIEKMLSQNGIHSYPYLPLEGYLIGERKPVYRWIFEIIQGNT